MAIPQIEEFQELIDFCSKDRLISPLDIWPSQAKDHVQEILSELIMCRESALKELNTLPAYIWLSKENGRSFNRQMNILFPEKITNLSYWVEQKTKDITLRTEDDLNKLHTDPTTSHFEENMELVLMKNSLECLVRSEAHNVQRYERFIAKVASSFMAYKYPTKQSLDPVDFNDNIAELIGFLKKAKKSEDKLQKYDDLLCLPTTKKDNYLQNKIDLYTAMLGESVFPVKKKIPTHARKMFIVSITKALFLDTNPFEHRNIKNRHKNISDFIFCLFDFCEVFDEKISRQKIKDTIKEENIRYHQISIIQRNYQKNNAKR